MATETTTRVYHVAGPRYEAGDDLLCWDRLTATRILADEDWHWDDAPDGWDGGVVCVYETLAEAVAHRDDLGGVILAIELPDTLDALAEDPGQYESYAGAGYLRPRPERVEEGYLAFRGGIPAAWIVGEVAEAEAVAGLRRAAREYVEREVSAQKGAES